MLASPNLILVLRYLRNLVATSMFMITVCFECSINTKAALVCHDNSFTTHRPQVVAWRASDTSTVGASDTLIRHGDH